MEMDYEETTMRTARVIMSSNYDCMNSHWLESNNVYTYFDSYFGDVIDVLNLNPKKVCDAMLEHINERCIDKFSFVDKPERNGKEYVDYDKFVDEIINSTCGVNLLTFAGCFDFDLNPNYENAKEIIVPEGTTCGLFDSWSGGGSLMGMKLKRDLRMTSVDLKENNWQPVLYLRKDTEYSIEDVYGENFDAFDHEIICNY